MGVSELIACLIAAPIKMKLKRIKTLAGFTLIASLSCIITIILNIPDECYLPENSCI